MKFTIAFILAAAVAVYARPVEPCASLDCTPNSAGTEEVHRGMAYGTTLIKAADDD